MSCVKEKMRTQMQKKGVEMRLETIRGRMRILRRDQLCRGEESLLCDEMRWGG